MKKQNDDVQYDSCVSRGICSINPRTYSLQRVLIRYLMLISKYALDLYKIGVVDDEGKELILNTLSLAVSNPEFTDNNFVMSVKRFREILPRIVLRYNDLCQEETIEKLDLFSMDLFRNSENLIDAIRYGEKDMLKAQQLSQRTRDYFRIMLVVAKSISIDLLDLESFGEKYNEGFEIILKMLTVISPYKGNSKIYKKLIYKAVNIDYKIMKYLRETQEKNYGKQSVNDVSYTTTPSKAILVVGSNIKELEDVLEAVKTTDIDVYTHDEMMIAHTFPKFREYKNLKGQYGHGLINCLLDFATFPGPIVLTKHSLHNIENFYRGRLFTTDYACPKGVIKIEDNDFSEVIESANMAKGFKRGKNCETVSIGYDFDETINEINQKIDDKKYERIFIIGLEKHSFAQNAYFEKLVKNTPDNVLIISFSYKFESSNTININTCFDSYSVIKVYDELKTKGLPIVVFVPMCDKNSISQMIYMSNCDNARVFVGTCTPIILTPSLMDTLNESFNIKPLTSAKKDLQDIFED
ncbi:MAG: hypothetical protein MJ231_00945 [bacterium]|nr:hypothetical protein [bacterium]